MKNSYIAVFVVSTAICLYLATHSASTAKVANMYVHAEQEVLFTAEAEERMLPYDTRYGDIKLLLSWQRLQNTPHQCQYNIGKGFEELIKTDEKYVGHFKEDPPIVEEAFVRVPQGENILIKSQPQGYCALSVKVIE